MEACGVAVGKFLAALKLLECQPSAVGECVFHLVAVAPYLFRTFDRADFGNVDFGDSLERVGNLTLFACKLEIVGKMLPATSSAYAEMLATRLYANFAGSDEPMYVTFGVGFAFFVNFYVNHIARSSERHEDNHVVDAGKRVAFSRYVGNRDCLEDGKLFAFSCHYYLMFIIIQCKSSIFARNIR